ncbi:amino acid ABC transporter substrate-binding protein [Mesorhizobium sp. M3A.F.Ca.ET.174.01.1.1]|uniref:amino acid ABC transporter substrate-binding protein n=1 Tax=unclassified Mesorhizobium TaxID=325217 RepID=UPI00109410C2|nr:MULTISPECIES: amino acid ABC transporter substrate-binding protein [unclassified Mesorhizobium]TGS81050.1 amino acid ABC transporter substrate-binding protein [Mesorhizobium sp. M3A.F.Ca.ET.175.01.1.1]TGT21772.1 amino acid ABC transporter substrate-binding protein [Mesorhizobium sp. M3A.F.Ca.ET.174.01.1.1]
MKKALFAATMVVTGSWSGVAFGDDTLAQVKARGELFCGVGENFPGFFSPDSTGKYSGFDVDFCHAVAAAALGDAKKVKFVPTTPSTRFSQLQSGQVDLLSQSDTYTFSRDASLGLDFALVMFYDGHGLMVPKSLGAKSGKDLNGANVCTQTGLSTEVIIADYFKSNGMTYSPVVFESRNEALAAFESGRCDVFSSDRSTLSAYRSALKKPDDFVILDDTISRSLNGPVIRHGDNRWADIIRWTGFALIAAEDFGITSENVDEKKVDPSSSAEVRRLLGVEGGFGQMLGLADDWAYQAVKSMGNYGQIYERNLGPEGSVHIPRERTLNALWKDGGAMIAPSFQ